MMSVGSWINFAWMVFVALIALGLLYWGWRRGQFHNAEEPKYSMLEDREPSPWPSKKGRRP